MAVNQSITVINEKNDPRYEMSYEEIAQIMGITPREVRKIEQSALKKLRHPKYGAILKKMLKENL